MAIPSDQRDTTVRPPGSKYPWEEWQDGRWWTITKDVDFAVNIQVMRDQLHVRAKATSTKVKTFTDKESRINFVFSLPDETEDAFQARISKTATP